MNENYSTEEKIKKAAAKLFQQKGYAATRTRDIAEEAGINLALLNYYYRSKENLFEIVMIESIRSFFPNLQGALDDENTSVNEKLVIVANKYFDLLSENPNLPFFIMGSIQSNPDSCCFLNELGVPHDMIYQSYVYKQLVEMLKENNIKDYDLRHLFINFISLIIFPFMSNHLIKCFMGFSDVEFKEFIGSRRKLIPVWIESMIQNMLNK